MTDYTKEELNEFRALVEAGESRVQMDRIRNRLEMPKFVARMGKEKCDAMFKVLTAEHKEAQKIRRKRAKMGA